VNIAVFDDMVPHLDRGAGYPRANALLSELAGRCERVSFFAMNDQATATVPDAWTPDIDRRIELLFPPPGYPWDLTFERLRDAGFTVLWISRPANMRTLAAAFAQRPDLRAAFTIVYDAEALYAPRLAQALQLEGKPMPAEREAEELAAEFALARGADLIVSVGPGEARALAVGTGREVFVLGFTSLREPTPADFSARRNFGFVGPIRLLSPNEDAILWYAANVLREVAARTGAGLRVCGLVENSMLPIYAGPKFQLVGALDDLSPFFNAIRVFVAPTRYAAGLPQKLIDAASAGVPIVATSLLAGQLGWRDGVELLVADEPRTFAEACVRLYGDAKLWAALRENARVRIAEVYGPGCFARELDRIMEALADRPPRHTAPVER